MTRRLEAGPLLAAVGALLLLVSLTLSWYTGDLGAWEAFEVWDLVLGVLALGVIAAVVGRVTQHLEQLDRRVLPAVAVVATVIVAAQIIDPPPAALGAAPTTGAWLALGAALVMCAGAVLAQGRVRLTLTVEGRERQHVAAVDARGPADPTTDNVPAVDPGGARLFAREARPRTSAPAAGNEPAEPKQE